MIAVYVIRKAKRLDRQPANIAREPWGLYVSHDDSVLETRLAGFPSRKAAVAHASLLAGWRVPVRVERT